MFKDSYGDFDKQEIDQAPRRGIGASTSGIALAILALAVVITFSYFRTEYLKEIEDYSQKVENHVRELHEILMTKKIFDEEMKGWDGESLYGIGVSQWVELRRHGKKAPPLKLVDYFERNISVY